MNLDFSVLCRHNLEFRVKTASLKIKFPGVSRSLLGPSSVIYTVINSMLRESIMIFLFYLNFNIKKVKKKLNSDNFD